MKKENRLLKFISVIALIILLFGLFCFLTNKPVESAGTTTVNCSSIGNYWLHFSGGSSWLPFSTAALASQSTNLDSNSDKGERSGISCSTNDEKWNISKSIVGFDVSSIPYGADIKSVVLYSKSYATQSAGASSQFVGSYLTYYLASNPYPHYTPSVEDWRNAKLNNNVSLFHVKSFSSYPQTSGSTVNFTMFDGWLNLFLNMQDSHHYVWFTFAFERIQLNAQPDFQNMTGVEIYNSGASTGAYLSVTYVGGATQGNLQYPTNSGNPEYGSSELAQAMVWDTPRCLFSKEDPCVTVNGSIGATISLICNDAQGNLLAESGEHYIQTDGYYHWKFPILSSYSGWFRVTETRSNIKSTWAYFAQAPPATVKNLMTYAINMSFPQYDNDFSLYSVYKDGLMFVFWATNVGSDELNDYNLALWQHGNSNYGVLFDWPLQILNTDYYSTNYTDNYFAAKFRYMIFTPQIATSGFNTGDGLIYNLGRDYSLINSGFIVPVIYDNSTGSVITTCHSAYYYLNNSNTDGVSISMAGNQASQPITVNINIGQYSHIADRLENVQIDIIDNAGSIYSTATGTIANGPNVGLVMAPQSNGNYQLRCSFYDFNISPYYELILDKNLTIVGGTTPTTTNGTSTPMPTTPKGGYTDWKDLFKRILEKYHLDNEAGHWLIIAIICALWVATLIKHPLAMTIMIVLTVGGALILGWLNPWFYILLVLGAGFYIWKHFKKKDSSDQEA